MSHHHRHLLPHLPGALFPGDDQGRAQSREHGQAAQAGDQAVRSRRALPRDGSVRRLSRDHLAAQSADRGHRRRQARPDAGAHRQRCHGGAVPQASRAVSDFCRCGIAERRGRLGRGGAARGQGSRRLRHPGLHAERRASARRSDLRAGVRDHGRARPADLAASGARRDASPTIPPRRSRATNCGGASAGPTTRRSRWCGWRSADCSTAIRSSRSSPTISAA